MNIHSPLVFVTIVPLLAMAAHASDVTALVSQAVPQTAATNASQLAELATRGAGADVLNLVTDDGSIEALTNVTNIPEHNITIGAVWLNRFVVSQPVTVDSISIFWSDAGGLVLGMEPLLVAYYDADADGDPANAQRLGSDVVVSIDQLNQFQTYPVTFNVPGAGDVYIGFVDIWARTPGGLPGLIFAASRDTTDPHCRSYNSWNSDPDIVTNIDNLGANTHAKVLDSDVAGNLMIRATALGGLADPIHVDGFDHLDVCTPAAM